MAANAASCAPRSATMAFMPSDRHWDLRITRRCLREDLHLDPDASGSAEEYVEVHRRVTAFVERRGQSRIGQETFRCGTEVTGLPLYTLHFGDDRGATWHQELVPWVTTCCDDRRHAGIL